MATTIDQLNVEIKASATSAINAINKLEASLRNLQGTLNTLDTSRLSGMASKLGSIASSSSGGLGLFSKRSNAAAKSSASLAATIGKLYATFWMLRGVGNAFGGMIDVASDLTEVENVVDNTFYGMRTKVDEFVEDSATKFGMAELSAKQYASRFQAMGLAMGITGSQVENATSFLSGIPTSMDGVAAGYDTASNSLADMSLNLTKLTADMASFYNVEQSQVAGALQSGVMAGQSRALRQYGLDLTQATVQEWALANGLNADMSAMTQAQKTMLRYQYVLANTANIQGDFERTSHSWHNQVVQLKAAYQQLAATIGTGLINAFKPFLSGLNSVLQAVTSFAEQVLNALGKIFGWEVEISASGVADSLGGAADAAGDLSDAAGGTGGGLKDAGKEADKLKRKLLSFDELHVLDFGDTNTDANQGGGGGGGGGGAGGGGGGAGDGQVTASIKYTKKLFESEIDSLYELGEYIGDALADAMESINWDSVYEKARNFGKGLAEFLNGLISPRLFYDVGMTIANSLNTAIYAKLSFDENFDWTNFGNSLAAGVNGFFENFDSQALEDSMKTFAKGVKTALIAALSSLKWNDITQTGKDIGSGIAGAINEVMDPELFSEAGESLAKALNTAVTTAFTIGKSIKWKDAGQAVANGINDFFKEYDADEMADALNTFAEGIRDSLVEFVKTVDWKLVVSKIIETLTQVDWLTINEVQMAAWALRAMTIVAGKLAEAVVSGPLLVKLGAAFAKLIASAIKGAVTSAAVKSAAGGIGGAVTAGAAGTATGTALAPVAGGAVAGATGGSLATVGGLSTGLKAFQSLTVFAWVEELTNKFRGATNSANNLGYAMSGVGTKVDKSKITYENLSKALIGVRDTGWMSTLEMYNSQAALKAMQSSGKDATYAYDSLSESFKVLGSASIPEFNNQINNASESSKKLSGFGETATSVWASVKTAFNGIGDTIGSNMERAGRTVGTGVSNIGNALSNGWNTASSKVSDVFDSIKEAMTTPIQTASTSTGVNIKNTQASMIGGWGPVVTKVSGFFSDIKGKMTTETGTAQTEVGKKVEDIKGKFAAGWQKATTGIAGTFGLLKKDMTDNTETAKGNVSSRTDSIKAKFTTGWNIATQAIRSTFTTLQDTMTKAITTAKTSIGTAVKAITGFFTGLKLTIPDIKSPSQASLNSVESTISGFVSRVKSYFNGLNLDLPKPHITLPTFSLNTVLKKVGDIMQSVPTSISVSGWTTYATGGFPEEGPFFMNRGEIAGRFSNGKNVVANNHQIIEGIKQGVIEAMLYSNEQSGGNSPVIEFTLKAGEDTLYRAVRRGEQKYNRRFSAVATV